MAITLAEAKVGMADHVDQQVVDMFRRSSLLLDRLTFDNAISPGTGGSTLTYGYTQLKTPSMASVREINKEYTANEAKREKKTAEAIIMGGKFGVDRVIQNTSGAIDEMAFQMEQKIKATANEFHYYAINGTKAGTYAAGKPAGTFDGLAKLLSGTSNEVTSEVDISTAALMTSNAQAFLDEIDAFLSGIDGANILMMNTKMLTKFRGIARRAGYYERSKNDFGQVVETYGGIPMVDLGKFYNGKESVDVIETTEATQGAGATTAIYAASLSLDGFFGIAPMGTGVIQSFLPNMNEPGAVKEGEVELVAGVALKNTLKAGVLKGITLGSAAAAASDGE